MRIQRVRFDYLVSDSAEVTLWKEGLVADSRPIDTDNLLYKSYKCIIIGSKMIVKANRRGLNGIPPRRIDEVFLRIYDPETETVPKFNNKTYTYYGLPHERAPCKVKEIVIHESVKTILNYSFANCTLLTRCIMTNNVEEIKTGALSHCHKLKHVRLSNNLRIIGECAFAHCHALECLFIPSKVISIGFAAISSCSSLKMIFLPSNIETDDIGLMLVIGSEQLLTNKMNVYRYNIVGNCINSHQVNSWLKSRYEQTPLLRLCANTQVTSTMIKDQYSIFSKKNRDHSSKFFRDEFLNADEYNYCTPLHILTGYNGFAEDNTIIACFNASPMALFI